MSITTILLFAIKILLFLTNALSTDPIWNNSTIGQDNYAEDAPSAAPQISDFEMIDYRPTLYTRLKSGNQVALYNGTKEFCGGTVLDARHILTSVQCVFSVHHPAPGPLYVLTSTGKVAAEAEMMYVPKSFEERVLLENDIAVLKLDRDLPLGSDGLGKPAQLPKLVYSGVYHTYENQMADIVGHAPEAYESQDGISDKPTMVFPKKLLIGKAEVLPRSSCVSAWGTYIKMQVDSLCAKVPPGLSNQGYCQSDVGYGIVINGTVIGVASFGNAFCHRTQAEEKVPATFTRVTLWIPFIHAAIADDTASELLRSYAMVINSGGAAQMEDDYWVVLWKSLVMVVAAFFV